jgi:hypothetical protein
MVATALLKKARGTGCLCVGRNASIDKGRHRVAWLEQERRHRAARAGLESAYFHRWLEEEGRWAAAMPVLTPGGWTVEGMRSVRTDASVPQNWWPDGSRGMGLSVSITPLDRAQLVCLSTRTVSDTRGPNGSVLWRCPYPQGKNNTTFSNVVHKVIKCLCGVARQRLCRAYRALCHANSCTAKTYFPVVMAPP